MWTIITSIIVIVHILLSFVAVGNVHYVRIKVPGSNLKARNMWRWFLLPIFGPMFICIAVSLVYLNWKEQQKNDKDVEE